MILNTCKPDIQSGNNIKVGCNPISKPIKRQTAARKLLAILPTIVALRSTHLSVKAFQCSTPHLKIHKSEKGLDRQTNARSLISGFAGGGSPLLNRERTINNMRTNTALKSEREELSQTRRILVNRTQNYNVKRSVSARKLSLDDRTTEGITLKTPAIDPNAYDPVESDLYSIAVKKTVACVALSVAFGLAILAKFGMDSSAEFFAGYLVEQSLSVDNLFVFLLLFDYFKVPLKSQDRVLTYGIYGAVVMRAIMISLGAVALERYHAILLVFAGILVYSSGKVLFDLVSEEEEEEEDMSENAIVKFSTSLFNATDKFDGKNFFTMEEGVRKATPLFLCLVAVEISDVVFAIDSIPAVFGVTENPLIVFSSNMFAILGLRSVYTILSKAARDLEYLEPAVAIVLGFIGSKMVAEYFGTIISTEFSLGVVLTCLSVGVGLSVWKKNEKNDDLIDSSSDIK